MGVVRVINGQTGCRAVAVLFLVAFTLLSAPGIAGPPDCEPGSSGGAVERPVFVRNLSGQTSWYASPVIHDLDGDGSNELIAAYYDTYVPVVAYPPQA